MHQHIVQKQNLLPELKSPSLFSLIYYVPIYYTLCTSPNLPLPSCRTWHMDQLYSWVPHLSNRSPLFWFFEVYLQPLASNLPFYFKNVFFKFSILSLIKTKSSAYKILFIIPSLAFSETTSTAIVKSSGDNTDP